MTESRWTDRITETTTLRIGDLKPNPQPFLRWSEDFFEGQSTALGALGKLRILRAYRSERAEGALTLLDLDGDALRTLHPDEPWRVAILDRTDAEADLARPLEYRLGQLAELDEAALAAIVGELQVDDAALRQLLDGAAVELSLEELADGDGGGDDFDTAPPAASTRTNPGELWIIGDIHRLVIGDATAAATHALLLAGRSPALLLADPPYGVHYDPTWRHEAGLNRSDGMRGDVVGDDRAEWSEVYAALSAPVVYIWHAGLYAGVVGAGLERIGYDLVAQIIWAKEHFTLSRGDYHWQHEPCWYAVQRGQAHHWQGARDQSTLWTIPRLSSNAAHSHEAVWGHGTQKPLECMLRPILNNSRPGTLVVDPFLGTGTSLIAAHRAGRVCHGAEVDPRYGDVILRRAEAEGLSIERVE